MIVLCAWCEHEGRPAFLSGSGASDEAAHSHGICEAHEQVLLTRIEALRKQDLIRHMPRRLCLPHTRGNTAPITFITLAH